MFSNVRSVSDWSVLRRTSFADAVLRGTVLKSTVGKLYSHQHCPLAWLTMTLMMIKIISSITNQSSPGRGSVTQSSLLNFHQFRIRSRCLITHYSLCLCAVISVLSSYVTSFSLSLSLSVYLTSYQRPRRSGSSFTSCAQWRHLLHVYRAATARSVNELLVIFLYHHSVPL